MASNDTLNCSPLLPITAPLLRINPSDETQRETLQIVLQWMISQGYTAAAQVLRSEVSAQNRAEHLARKHVSAMIRGIEDHNWEKATKSLKRLQSLATGDELNFQLSEYVTHLGAKLPFLFAQQQFLEIIDSDSDGARAFSFFMKNVKPFERSVDLDQFKKLCYLLTCKSVIEAAQVFPEYSSWSPGEGCAQLLAFIDRTLGDTLLNASCIANLGEDSFELPVASSLETHIEEALSFRLLSKKFPQLVAKIPRRTIVSLTSPLLKQLPSSDLLLKLDLSSIHSTNENGVYKGSVTSCVLTASGEYLVVSFSTGEVIAILMESIRTFKNSELPPFTIVYKSSESVRGMTHKKNIVFCWGGRQGVLLAVQSFSHIAHPTQYHFLRHFKFKEDIYSGCLLPDESVIGTGHADGTIAVWDVECGKQLYQQKISYSPVISLILNRTGTVFYAAAQDGTVTAVDAPVGISLFSFMSHIPMEISAIALSPSSQRLLVAYRGGTLRVWDTISAKEMNRRFLNTENTMSKAAICFGSFDHHIFCGSDDGSVLFWDTLGSQEQDDWSITSDPDLPQLHSCNNRIQLHKGPITFVVATQELLFSCGSDGVLAISQIAQQIT